MPFPDEAAPVEVADHRPRWAEELAGRMRAALGVPDLAGCGQIKAPATEVLMAAAEQWAAATGWAVR